MDARPAIMGFRSGSGQDGFPFSNLRKSYSPNGRTLYKVGTELLPVQASILRDKTTGARYRLPSNMTRAAIRIYRAFNLKRSLTPTPIATDT